MSDYGALALTVTKTSQSGLYATVVVRTKAERSVLTYTKDEVVGTTDRPTFRMIVRSGLCAPKFKTVL